MNRCTPHSPVHVELCGVSDEDLGRLISAHHKAFGMPAEAPCTDEASLLRTILEVCERYGLRPRDASETECLREFDRRCDYRRVGSGLQLAAA